MRALAGLSAGLINVIRGIPIIVLLFYLYFVMPDFGVALTALQASILGLGIAYSAYQAENFRAGIEAIDKGTDRGGADHRHGLVAHHAPGGAAAGGEVSCCRPTATS